MRNSVMLIGRPGAEPEIKNASNNQKVARFRIAVNEGRMNANKEWIENTQWFSVVAFGYMAERVEKVVRKGKQVAVEGSLHNNDWTDQKGERHSTTEVWVSDLFPIEVEKTQTNN